MAPLLDDSNFESTLENEPKALVEFFATWCPHCQRMQPIVDKIADELKGKTPVYQVDVDKAPVIAQEYTEGFPAFAIFEYGNLANIIMGEQKESTILELVEYN